MKLRSALILLLALAMSMVAMPAMADTGPTGHDKIPSAVPSTISPAVNNGYVQGIVQVGTTMVIGGTFTSLTPPGGSSTARSKVAAFDASTGALRAFNPSLNGDVTDVLAGPTSGTVYVAGYFSQIDGVATSHLALLNATTGAPVAGFKAPSTNGVINTITKAGNRLLLGGNFTIAGGQTHQGLAAIDQSTGSIDHSYMALNVSEHHNNTGSGSQGAIGVRDMEATPDGSKLVALGNFKKVAGLDRDQLVVIDLSGATAAVDLTWRTRRYEPLCFNWAFDTYVRGMAVSPDGSFFVVNATGGHNAGTLCDTASRFELGATGDDIQPTWVDDAGGDTLWGAEITEQAVYVGGHQRWLNNSDGSDTPGQGAVPRPGLGALDLKTGLPLKWNPGRLPRGAAVYEIYATPAGLWVGSDTDYIGNYKYKRPKLAFFPLAGGAEQRSDTVATLPGNVYLGGPRTTDQGNVLYRVNGGGAAVDGIDGGPAWTSDEGASSQYHNSGNNAAGYNPVASQDSSVPASTPSSIFSSELWSPSDNPRMSWSFPAQTGLPLQVRLYFANRCSCTSNAGQRAFDVSIDANKVLDNYDIVADVGDQKGTMKSFDITSDGTVNIDFGHRKENPLINGIEIVRRDLPPPTASPSTVSTVDFDGTTATGPVPADARGIAWADVRGAFIVGDTLVYGKTDGYLYERTFTTTNTGPAIKIDPYNDPLWADAQNGVGGTERGTVPSLYGQLPSLTGIFYSAGRIYYTLNNDARLYSRWFNIDSGIVGSQVFTTSSSGWSDSGGMFKSGNTLYVVGKSTGNLFKVPFVNGQPSGVPTLADAGRDWRAKAVFIGPSVPQPPPNEDPQAAFTVSCTDLTCTVNGSASTDDGSIASYAWDFGDNGSATGVTPAPHTYAADGQYTITLTVTDNQGATSTASQTVDVAAGTVPSSNIGFVGRDMTSGNTTSPSVTVPSGVTAGDELVLIGSYGVAGASPSVPAGWTLASSRSNGPMESFVWVKRAVAGDAGSSVATPTGALMKSALTVAAYSNVASTGAVAEIASSADSSTATHVSPTVTAPDGAWVLQAWTDKSSGTTDWTAPSGVTVRGKVFGAKGGGQMAAMLADTNAAVSSGSYGGQTATSDATSGRGVAWTIALKPGAGGGGANQDPHAAFTVSCTDLTCTANGSGSTDDGSIASYAWDFGDSGSATGATPAPHTYAVDGHYTITLTVTDNQGATNPTSHAVDVAAGTVPASDVSFVGRDLSSGNTTNPSVTVPAAVQVGDQLILVGSYGLAGASPTVPAGWTQVSTRSNSSMESFVWTKRAVAGDAGTTVATPTGGLLKASLGVAAYRNVAVTGAIADVASSADASSANHVSATATAPAGGWVVQVWTDKSSGTTAWTSPSGVTVRGTVFGAKGGGQMSELWTDSGAPVAAGSYGGQTATTDATSGRAVAWTFTLKPAS